VYLLVGLGNWKKVPANSRHNFGFRCMDALIKKYGISTHQIKFKADIFFTTIREIEAILVKPRTFMNNSGIAVASVKSYYHIPNEDIFVFHDDLDLQFLRIKFKKGGQSGGHNGVKSLDALINQNYHRLRLGIGRPPANLQVEDFVLKEFSREELEKVDQLTNAIAENIQLLLQNNGDKFLTTIHRIIPFPLSTPFL
jgi:PTH1 family peptidyl-tRNA hydrolase